MNDTTNQDGWADVVHKGRSKPAPASTPLPKLKKPAEEKKQPVQQPKKPVEEEKQQLLESFLI